MGDSSALALRDDISRAEVYLHPGQMHVALAPTQITTILGSCVSVCMWDAERGLGGMIHYLLPVELRGPGASPRFGAVAIPALIEQLVSAGARGAALQAKVFGGSQRFGDDRQGSALNLGRGNVELAMRLLFQAGIPVAAQETGGSRGRKIVFHSDTGAAWVKSLGP